MSIFISDERAHKIPPHFAIFKRFEWNFHFGRKKNVKYVEKYSDAVFRANCLNVSNKYRQNSPGEKREKERKRKNQMARQDILWGAHIFDNTNNNNKKQIKKKFHYFRHRRCFFPAPNNSIQLLFATQFPNISKHLYPRKHVAEENERTKKK